MYEPLLGIEIPSHYCMRIEGSKADEASQIRKVVIVSEIWEVAQAEQNVVSIIETLLQSGKVDLILIADSDSNQQFARESVITTLEKQEEAIQKAKESLQKRGIWVSEYINVAYPMTQMFGVNDEKTLNLARNGRDERLWGLRRLFLIRDRLIRADAPFSHDLDDWEARWHSHRPSNLYGDVQREGFINCEDVFAQDICSQLDQDQREAVERLLNPKISAVYNPPDKPIPIIARLRTHLELLLAPILTQAPGLDKLIGMIARVKDNISGAVELVQLGEQYGFEMPLYQNLWEIYCTIELSKLDYQQVRQQQFWLQEQIMPRLLGKQYDVHALRSLFHAEARKLIYQGDDNLRLFSSRRPLYDCVRQTMHSLSRTIVDAIENNEPLDYTVASQLLNLASVFRLNDRYYSNFRKYVASRKLIIAMRGFDQEIIDLEESLISEQLQRETWITNELKDVFLELFRFDRYLTDLELLICEQLSYEAGDRIISNAPSAQGILLRLNELGASVSAEEKSQCKFLDERCVPPAIQFVESSRSQIRMIADGVLRVMSETGAETAILLCGGYYPAEVQRELTETGRVICSIITPHLSEQRASQADAIKLEELKGEATGWFGDIEIITLGDNFDTKMRKLIAQQQGKAVDEENSSGIMLDRGQDAKQWAARHGLMIYFEEDINLAFADRMNYIRQECRICHRLLGAPDDASMVVSTETSTFALVFQCPECDESSGHFVCTQCAGREPIALFPGHSFAEMQQMRKLVGKLVCNIHNVPLVSRLVAYAGAIQPTLLSQGLPGHSWYS